MHSFGNARERELTLARKDSGDAGPVPFQVPPDQTLNLNPKPKPETLNRPFRFPLIIV